MAKRPVEAASKEDPVSPQHLHRKKMAEAYQENLQVKKDGPLEETEITVGNKRIKVMRMRNGNVYRRYMGPVRKKRR